MSRRLIMFAISALALFVIVGFVRSIVALSGKGNVISHLSDEKREKEQENARLKEQLEYAKSSEFVEKQARDKLNLQKEGEVVVVLPKNVKNPSVSATPVGASPAPEANWMAWWKRVF